MRLRGLTDRTQKARWTWLMLLVAGLLAGLTGCSDDDDGPGGGGDEVVVYVSVDQEVAEPLIEHFQKETGIRVLARYDTEANKTVGLVGKLRAEKDAPLADVFWSGEPFHTIALAREGVLAPYTSETTANWPGDLIGKENRWYGFAFRTRVIAYNTQRVSEAEAPKRLEDLLDPKWKGRIWIADPGFGTTGGEVASWYAHYGPDRAREILRGLKANQVVVDGGNSTAVRKVAQGAADICLTDTDDVYAAQRNNWPVGMHVNDQNGDGPLVIPNTVALVEGAPNPGPAARFIEFLLSPQAERMLAASHSGNAPVHEQVAAEFPKLAVGKRLNVPLSDVADHLDQAIRESRDILEVNR